MPLKRLPDTDEGKLETLQAIIDQEELSDEENAMFSSKELQDLRNFLLIYEGSGFCFRQSLEDESKACKTHLELFNTVQLYVSHFIQVLYFSVIRSEIKETMLILYGLSAKDLTVPDLSTEEAILYWGELLIRGEADRISRGGMPIYNPAIAKVKVHFDLFKDSLHSVKIYRKNAIRNSGDIMGRREKANKIIWDVWTRVEEKCRNYSPSERERVYKNYRISFQHLKGIQLNVFD